MIGKWLDALLGRSEPAPAAEPVPLPEPVEQIRDRLKWFNRFEGPPDELVRWFATAHPRLRGPDAPEVLSVAAAVERRKWVLRAAAENSDDAHFEGRTNWLPLIVWGRDLFIYESGPHRSGLVVRRPDRRDEYPKHRARPMPLATFDLARLGAEPVDEPDDGEGSDESVLEQLVPLVGVRLRKGDWSLPFFKAGVPDALDHWFRTHDGQLPGELWFPEERVHGQWKALSLEEALVARDLLLEQAEPALAERLQRDPRWVPLFAVNGDDLLVFAEDRGVALHVKAAGRYPPVPWSRWSPLDAFLAATHQVWAPGAAREGDVDEALPWDLVAELQVVTEALEERMVQREGVSIDDAPQLAPFAAWFAANVDRPGPPLLAAGEDALSGREALAQRTARALPLARGKDGVVTAWVEKVGVAELRANGSIVPVNPTFEGWLEGLLSAADAERDARVQPGSIRRNLQGVWTVDVAPLVAADVVAALGALPWSFTRSGDTLTLERGPEVDVRSEAKSRLIIQLPDALIDQMIADLEALEGYEPAQLHWEEVHDLVLVVRARA